MSLGNRNANPGQIRVSRREFLRLVELTAAGALLAACTPTKAPAAEPAKEAAAAPTATKAAAAAEPKEIRFLYWDDFEGTYQSEAYMAEHPDVKIELIPYLDDSGKLDAMIAAGNPPDIFVVGGDDVYKYTSMDALLNFQPLADGDPDFDLSIYFPEAVVGWQSPEGDLYGLGPDFGMELLYYNKTLLDGAGIKYPDATWTWADMQAAAKALTKGEGASKQYGSVAMWGTAQQFPLVWQNGGEIFDADRRRCLMDSKEAIEALEYAYGFVRDGYAPTPQEINAMGMELGPFFATGRVGFTPGGHWYFRSMEQMEWDVTVLPGNKKPGTYLYQAIWSASSKTKHPDVCWDLIRFSCSPEWVEMFCVFIGGMPSIKSIAEKLVNMPEADLKAYKQKEAADAVSPPGVQKVWKAMFEGVKSARRPLVIPGITEISESVWTPAVDKMWTGDSTPAEVGKEITAGANKILDAEWAKLDK